MENKDIKVFNGETLPEKKISAQNENMMQIKSNYVAAMTVQKPRVMKNVISAVMEEATEAKDDFYYSWLVNNKKTGKKSLIEGPSIGLAQAIARNWTNCAVETEIREFGGEWIFKTTFVDFEKGFTTQREFRMLIPQKGDGNYDYERTRDMKFQMGQSKNQRGCICNAIPRWLINQALETAKAASQKDARHNTDGKLTKALSSFAGKGITEADLLGYFGKESINEFDAKIVAQLRNLWVQLQNKETTAEGIKRQGQDVFDETKRSRTRPKKAKNGSDTEEAKAGVHKPSKKIKDVKKDPQSDMGKAPAKQAIKEGEFKCILESFHRHDISDLEILAYFDLGDDDIDEMNCEQGLIDLRARVSDIESGSDPMEFKKIAGERLAKRLKEES